MDRAFADLFGVERAFRGIPMAGRMDPQILADAFDRAGLSITDGEEARFHDRYLACLREEIQQVHPDRRMMPAIRAVLDELAADEGVFLALLTGNYVEGARIKLEHFDLWRYFRSGAFGGDAPIRAGLVPVAMERARAFGWRAGRGAGRRRRGRHAARRGMREGERRAGHRRGDRSLHGGAVERGRRRRGVRGFVGSRGAARAGRSARLAGDCLAGQARDGLPRARPVGCSGGTNAFATSREPRRESPSSFAICIDIATP